MRSISIDTRFEVTEVTKNEHGGCTIALAVPESIRGVTIFTPEFVKEFKLSDHELECAENKAIQAIAIVS